NVHERGRTAALDLLLRGEMTHPTVATPLEVGEAAVCQPGFSLDHHLRKLDRKGVQLEVVPQQVPRLDRGEPGDGSVPDGVDLEGVHAGGQGRKGEPPRRVRGCGPGSAEHQHLTGADRLVSMTVDELASDARGI